MTTVLLRLKLLGKMLYGNTLAKLDVAVA